MSDFVSSSLESLSDSDSDSLLESLSDSNSSVM